MKYRIATGWQLFSYFFGGLMIVTGFFMSQRAIQTGAHNLLFVVGFATLFVLFAVMFILNTAKTLVELNEETIAVTTLLGRRVLALNEIRGYGTGDKNLFYLIPKGTEKNLTIPVNLAGRDQLLSFFTAKYPDARSAQFEEAKTHLLEDERFGATKEERATRLKTTATTALILNLAPFVLLLVILFSMAYYDIAMWIVFGIPWIAALVTRRMKGMIAATPKRNDPSPSFFLSILFTALAAFTGTVPRWHFYDIGLKAFLLFAVLGLTATWLYLTLCREMFAREEKKGLLYVGFGLLFCIYGAGLVMFTNCRYDRGPAQPFRAEIEDKHISHVKSETYYLSLSGWGTFADGSDFSVSSGFYGSVQRGDSIRINLFGGKWGLPWYRLERPGTLITPARE